ncbi:hypothetical protein BH23CHL2_BH23CHL2_19950 [soil metagenome]
MLKRMFSILLLIALVAPIIGSTPAIGASPDVVADQWIILDGPTGTVIAADDPDTRRPMASLTKIMTAVVALEHGHLDMPVTITNGDKMPESSAGIFVGTTSPLRTLLHALLLASGNDAAMAIARAVGGSAVFENDGARAQFVTWMNEKAQELGMDDTRFANPHGLDQDGHYSTPADLAVLTRYALTVPEFREIFGTLTFAAQGYEFVHGNQLPYLMDNVVGGKTGWTDGCGRCLIEVVRNGDREIIIVLMGSDLSWYDDAIALSNYAMTTPRPADSVERAGDVFDALWDRTDSLVAAGVEQRSWLWGMPRGDIVVEPCESSETGSRYLRLYEKGLMEINHPYSRMDSGWYITPGRLAAGLIEDQARIPVAGDINAHGPLYSDLTGVQWEPQQEGQPIARWLSSGGQFVARQSMKGYGVTAGGTSDETGLVTASVFEDYLWQTAPVVEAGGVTEGLLFNPPVLAIGFPITEPFWVTVPENGVFVDVLVQCFERRCLTYTPSHEAAWQIEMSNIGLHYDLWHNEPARFAGTDPTTGPRQATQPW